jgi:hypothetical protein
MTITPTHGAHTDAERFERLGLPPQEIIRRIEKVLEIDGTHTWEDMREMLCEGQCKIFWNEHGAWITEILVYPRKRTLNVWVVAGEMPEVMELQNDVERYAITMTCDAMTARDARFKDYGWQEQAMVLVKPITEEMNCV